MFTFILLFIFIVMLWYLIDILYIYIKTNDGNKDLKFDSSFKNNKIKRLFILLFLLPVIIYCYIEQKYMNKKYLKHIKTKK